MAQSSSLISGVARRYAGSLYELAAESGSVEAVETGLGQVEALIGEAVHEIVTKRVTNFEAHLCEFFRKAVRRHELFWVRQR